MSRRTQDRNLSGELISDYKDNNLVITINCLTSSEERTAHNREVTGSTPVGGINHLSVLKETDGQNSSDHKHEHTRNRHGAAASARGS
jgi:hypothetical protein